MKILLLGKYGEGEIVGGPERVARELFNKLVENKTDITFVEYFFSGYKDYSFFNKIAGKKIISRNFLRLGIIRIIFLIFRKKYDIVHLVYIQRFQIIILLLKNLLRIKIVSTFHGLTSIEIRGRKKSFSNRAFLDKWVENLAIRTSDLITFPSNLLFNEFKNNYKISSKNFSIIPNGVTANFVNIKNQIDYNKEYDVIFYNGFNPSINRGIKKVIEQLSILKKIKINLFVIGYSDIHFESRNDLNIVTAGFLEHNSLIEFFKGKHFIIKSDTFDSFPVMVLECMALGVIPIITQNIGIKDYIENGINGFIYDQNSPNGLFNLFNDISTGKYDLKKISEQARKINETLNWGTITNKYYKLYQSIL